ncbi:MAG: adenylate/guanylate cyclase domain-containing protein [Chloroflexota bacterium]
MTANTRYARCGDLSIAYQVIGEAPRDLIVNHGWFSNIEAFWGHRRCAYFLERLASFARVIVFDKRGTGLSDRVPITDLPTLEERMDDVRAVMDAVGSERAALYGYSEGAVMCALFAATYPERTTALVMEGSYARRIATDDYPWAVTAEQAEDFLEAIRMHWGESLGLEARAPSLVGDRQFAEFFSSYQRQSVSPGAALALTRMNFQIDIRHVLPSIRVPTLVLHRSGDRTFDVRGSRFLASQIPGAKYVELPGIDHLPWVGESVEATLDEIEEFVTGTRHAPEPDRFLATVLFTDIVGSTEHVAALGDRRWRSLLDDHHAVVRTLLARHRGQEVHTTGDGFLATFDGPARAVRCASEIVAAVRPLGIEVRSGVHTGEIERMGDDVGGLAVHIGARVCSAAGPSEVLASSTVKDLVAGSGIEFVDRGAHTLRGVPGEWHLFSVPLSASASPTA